MSRPPLPAPPRSMADEISPLPTLSADAAVEWLASHGIEVSANYLTTARRNGQIAAAIVAGKRRFSTAVLYRFVMELPTTTHRGPCRNGGKTA